MSRRFEMRLSDEFAERIDGARGDVPRATWIKRALEAALDEVPLRSPEVLAALRRDWESPELEAQFFEETPVLDAVAPEPSAGKGKASRPFAPVRSSGHLPTCRCPVCVPGGKR